MYIREKIVGRAVLFFTGEATRGVHDDSFSEITSDSEESVMEISVATNNGRASEERPMPESNSADPTIESIET